MKLFLLTVKQSECKVRTLTSILSATSVAYLLIFIILWFGFLVTKTEIFNKFVEKEIVENCAFWEISLAQIAETINHINNYMEIKVEKLTLNVINKYWLNYTTLLFWSAPEWHYNMNIAVLMASICVIYHR